MWFISKGRSFPRQEILVILSVNVATRTLYCKVHIFSRVNCKVLNCVFLDSISRKCALVSSMSASFIHICHGTKNANYIHDGVETFVSVLDLNVGDLLP